MRHVPRKRLTERIKATAETFLVAEDKETGKLAAFLNGVPTDEEAFRDEFFTDISLSNPEGKNIMLLGLDVRPEYRMQGLGRELVSRYCQKEAQKGRKKLFLTCLDEKVKMYEKFGFTDLGQANSTWGRRSLACHEHRDWKIINEQNRQESVQ